MITQQKRKVDGWTIEKMTFPKGYQPRAVKWRFKAEEDLYQVEVNTKVPEGVNPNRYLEQVEDAVLSDDGTLTGWKTMSRQAYDWDRYDAEAQDPHLTF